VQALIVGEDGTDVAVEVEHRGRRRTARHRRAARLPPPQTRSPSLPAIRVDAAGGSADDEHRLAAHLEAEACDAFVAAARLHSDASAERLRATARRLAAANAALAAELGALAARLRGAKAGEAATCAEGERLRRECARLAGAAREADAAGAALAALEEADNERLAGAAGEMRRQLAGADARTTAPRT
jgi:hypothetical protein